MDLVSAVRDELPGLKLMRADVFMLKCAQEGTIANVAGSPLAERTVSAVVLQWLLTSVTARTQMTSRGVHIAGATVLGDIDLFGAAIPFVFQLVSSQVEGTLRLQEARTRTISCHNSRFTCIMAERLHADGDVFLDGEEFSATDGIVLMDATVAGALSLSRGWLGASRLSSRKAPLSLLADRLVVQKSVFMRDGFRSAGGVSLARATIGERLDLDGHTTLNCDKELSCPDAFLADGARIAGDVFMREHFECKGRLSLIGAHIGGQLSIAGATFESADHEGTHTPGGLVCGTAKFTAPVAGYPVLDASYARIEGGVDCRGLRATGRVSLKGATVVKELQWQAIDVATYHTELDLRDAELGQLADDPDSWPLDGGLHIAGLTYRSISGCDSDRAKNRLAWLRRVPRDEFSRQPYEQLANLYENRGYREAARRVRKTEAAVAGQCGDIPKHKRLLRSALGLLTGYGFYPWRPLYYCAVAVVVGCLFFSAAADQGVFVPRGEAGGSVSLETKPDAAPFRAPMYVIDTFLPLVDFGYADRWSIVESRRFEFIGFTANGFAVTVFSWALQFSGWVLGTALLAGVSGVISRRMQ
jgi:hypothetical protein